MKEVKCRDIIRIENDKLLKPIHKEQLCIKKCLECKNFRCNNNYVNKSMKVYRMMGRQINTSTDTTALKVLFKMLDC